MDSCVNEADAKDNNRARGRATRCYIQSEVRQVCLGFNAIIQRLDASSTE